MILKSGGETGHQALSERPPEPLVMAAFDLVPELNLNRFAVDH
jgi:hypothetical protein